jgi:hypothetical protein
MAPAITTKRKNRPRRPDAQKTGPKPIFGERMTGAERERRRKEKLAEKLTESLVEAKAAREDLDRLAAASQQALEAFAGIAAAAKARAETDNLAELAEILDAQMQAAQKAGSLAREAWAAALRFNEALETALHTRGKASHASPKKGPVVEEATTA